MLVRNRRGRRSFTIPDQIPPPIRLHHVLKDTRCGLCIWLPRHVTFQLTSSVSQSARANTDQWECVDLDQAAKQLTPAVVEFWEQPRPTRLINFVQSFCTGPDGQGPPTIHTDLMFVFHCKLHRRRVCAYGAKHRMSTGCCCLLFFFAGG